MEAGVDSHIRLMDGSTTEGHFCPFWVDSVYLGDARLITGGLMKRRKPSTSSSLLNGATHLCLNGSSSCLTKEDMSSPCLVNVDLGGIVQNKPNTSGMN